MGKISSIDETQTPRYASGHQDAIIRHLGGGRGIRNIYNITPAFPEGVGRAYKTSYVFTF